VLIPLPLALPVPLRPRRIVLAYLCPVIRVLRTPLLGAVQTHLPIHRVGSDLPAMVIVTASTLAGRIATDSLSRLKLGWLKRTLAIAADPFSHEPVLACHSVRLPDEQFRNSCRVRTASPPMGRLPNYKTGENAAVLFRR
jgi:hypothetical protein